MQLIKEYLENTSQTACEPKGCESESLLNVLSLKMLVYCLVIYCNTAAQFAPDGIDVEMHFLL